MQRLNKVILTHPLPDEWIASIRDRCEIVVGPDNSMGLDPALETHFKMQKG